MALPKFMNCLAGVGVLLGITCLMGSPVLAGEGADTSKDLGPDLIEEDTSSWLDMAVTPVTNAVWFEDARITSELRPFMMYHFIDEGWITDGGDAQLYALQFRYAITDRLAFIAVKDGLIDFNPDQTLPDDFDIADIALGLKYQIYRNDEQQLLITPGLTFEIPVGAEDVFQGNGSGMFQPFVSFTKGFDRFQIAGNGGFHIPIDYDEETAQAHYSLHAHYFVNKYFIPLVEMNGFTVLTDADRLPGLKTEGADLFNFGSGDADGRTFISLGVGLRSKPFDEVELGFAWEKMVTGPANVFDHRFTADVIYRF
jgi:hypothetical protein